jgi:hypothetical protein
MRVPTTVQLAEILADYLQHGMMGRKQINAILKRYNCGFEYKDVGDDASDIDIEITADDAIPDDDLSKDHPNVRRLVSRMESALEAQDFPAVLHAAASVFETLAKDVMKSPAVSDETLGGFFAGYKKKSLLPAPVLDYMCEKSSMPANKIQNAMVARCSQRRWNRGSSRLTEPVGRFSRKMLSRRGASPAARNAAINKRLQEYNFTGTS